MEEDLFRWEEAIVPVPGDTPTSPRYLKIPSFSLQPGKVTVIAGESGAGKSFFLSSLVGLTDPSTIHPRFHGLFPLPSLRQFEPALQDFVYVPQFPAVRRELTTFAECMLTWSRLLENVDADERQKLLGADQDLERRYDILANALELTNDGVRLEKRIGELSGGQLKRFGLLLRLPFYAPILVLDEPDTGLAHAQAAKIIDFLRSASYRELFGRPPPAILMVTHGEKLHELADRTVKVERWTAPAGDTAGSSAPLAASAADLSAPTPMAPKTTLSLSRWEAFTNELVHRGIHECRHLLTIFLRSFQDSSILLLSPVLIYLVLLYCEKSSISGAFLEHGGQNEFLDNRFSKYAFFAIIASTWLGIQLYGKIIVTDAGVLKEEFSWIANIRGGWRNIVWAHVLGIAMGHFFSVVVTSFFQAAVGAMIFFWQPFGWEAGNWQVFPFIVTPIFCANLYGGFLGLALGGAISWWQLDVWRPRKKPNLTWVNLLVPVIMLFQILFSPVYILGKTSADINTFKGGASVQSRLVVANVSARLCSWMDAGYQATNKLSIAEDSKLTKNTARRCLTDGTILVLAGWLMLFTVIFVFCLHRVLLTPEVRRE